MSEKCQFHDDLKAEVDKQAAEADNFATWRAGISEKMNAVVDAVTRNANLTDKNTELTHEVKRCIIEIQLSLAKEYVSKDEFKNSIKNIEGCVEKVHERMDADAEKQQAEEKHRKEYTLRLLSVVFAGGAVTFAVVNWVIDLIQAAISGGAM